ncbi:MAG: NepR family anti-sigma factor [Caulobacteraceae bacterium]
MGIERWSTPSEGGIILSMARKGSPKRPLALDEARLRQQAIGAQLRQMFEDVVKEPVPREFLDILRKADGDGADED